LLRRGDQEIRLRPKAFAVLAYFVERPGRLVSKTELIEAVWPDAAVTDNSLIQCVREIRQALDDESEKLIRTVARRGYVFAAPVTTLTEFPLALEPAAHSNEALAPAQRTAARPQPGSPRIPNWRAVAVASPAIAVLAALALWLRPPPRHQAVYQQITNFSDSAVSPVLSPDGRMLAFIRSGDWWLTSGQIWVKLLPGGEPIQVTRDPRPKYGLSFSPDGSRIAYTVVEGGVWKTITVSSIGGEPSLMLSNAAGLTWLDTERVLFSEIKTGVHMGVVTAKKNRSEYQPIYFPHDERGMVHLSYASPDRKWALVVEMNPVWQPCRVVPLDGSAPGRQVGPKGKCTSASWSPDGKWMYFGADVDGHRHLWRQRFPHGEPEQFTFGPTEEDGIAIAADGGSLITSIGIRQGELWVHTDRGDRQLSLEGHVPTLDETGRFGAAPVFSRDGRSVFYLRRESSGAPFELWRADLESGASVKVLTGFSILEYDLSKAGDEVVFSTQPAGQGLQIWLAPLDLSRSPRLVSSADGDSPHFGSDGSILFRMHEGAGHYLARMNRDGSGRTKVVEYPIGNVQHLSPDRLWLTTISPLPDGGAGTLAVPTTGGAAQLICRGGCAPVDWSKDGKFLYVTQPQGKTAAVPLRAGETLPKLPPSGLDGLDVLAAFPGARLVEAGRISPGPDPALYAYVRAAVHRNLFRIPLGTN
jgi:DNA-binding winged helix-turn-helix (wHTH) protein/Tol biopolymer transport system component